MCPVPVVPVVYTGRVCTEHTWYFTVLPTSAFWNWFCAELIGLVCVIGREDNGRRVKTPLPHRTTGASTPAMSNRLRCCRCRCCSESRACPPHASGRQTRRKNQQSAFAPASTSTTFGVSPGEHELSPAARLSCCQTNSCWEVISRYIERNTGRRLQWYCLTGLCGVSACVDAWNPSFQRMASQCSGTGLMSCRTNPKYLIPGRC